MEATPEELLNAGYEVVVVDNLYNSCEEALRRVEKITGKTVTFYNVDLLDKPALEEVFQKEKIDSVIQFAGYKAVGESVAKPLEYYQHYWHINSLRRNEKVQCKEYCI